MRYLNAIITRASSLLVIVATLSIFLMMVNIIVDVFVRLIFDKPVPATAEISAYYYMVAAVFLPLPLVELRGDSIRVDLFYNFFRLKKKRIINLFAYTAHFLFFAIIFWQTGQDAIAAYIKSDFVDSQIQLYIWPGRFFLPLGFGLAAIVSALKIGETLIAILSVDRQSQ